MRPLPVAFALLALVAALGAPASAHAIPADLTIAAPAPVPLAPATTNTTAVFEYRCSGFSTDNTPGPQSVAFAVSRAPSWVEATIEPARVELEPCATAARVVATVTMSARQGSVSLAGDELTLLATWHTDGFDLNVTATTKVAAQYVPAFRVEAQLTEIVERPQTPVVFPVKLVNLANGMTRFQFDIVSKEGRAEAVLPQPITLPAEGGASEASVPFTMLTPYKNGRVTDTTTLVMRITPHSPLDPTVKGEPKEVTLTLHTKGWYAPGPSVALAALSLGGALLLGRRLRRG